MIKTVIKRDGRKVSFDLTRITKAISKAMESVKFTDENKVASQIAKNISWSGEEEITVEQIQDRVEKQLMTADLPDVAKAYIVYRHERTKTRNAKSDTIISDIIAAKKNDVTRENANMNADTPAGMMMKIASERSKEYGLEYLINEKARKAVEDNILHIHDFDYYPTGSLTCLQHPVDRILTSGFQAGHGEARPAKRIETASILACISLESIQNEMHGGQAIPAFDFYMAPYVRSTFIEELKKAEALSDLNLEYYYNVELTDYTVQPVESFHGVERCVQHAINETVKRVHQSMEAFIHNLNTIHSRGGNQVVFSSVNYGTDTSAEGRCVIREMLRSTYEGVGNGATAIFPIQIWKKKRGVNYLPGDPNYDLYQEACKVTARRFFPNFINLDATFNQSEDWDANDPMRYLNEPATMGCRTRVFENRNGKVTSVGRGNLSFSTINLPGLALSVMDINNQVDRITAFFEKLNEALDIMGKQLLDRYHFQCKALAKQFPLLMSGMWNGSESLAPTDSVESVLKQGTLGIGFIGLAECLVALTGHHHAEDSNAQALGIQIIKQMKNRAAIYSVHTGLNYSVLATPAEGLSGKFTKKDKIKYGIVPGVTDRDYYTNSNHVPVYYRCSAAHKAAIEGPYHALTLGGHIFYVELDSDATKNVQAVMDVVDLMDKNNIGYGSVNHTRNRCMNCGYEDAQKELKVCPKCGSTHIDRLQRITGYLVGTTDRWNSGKLAELNDRVTHG